MFHQPIATLTDEHKNKRGEAQDCAAKASCGDATVHWLCGHCILAHLPNCIVKPLRFYWLKVGGYRHRSRLRRYGQCSGRNHSVLIWLHVATFRFLVAISPPHNRSEKMKPNPALDPVRFALWTLRSAGDLHVS